MGSRNLLVPMYRGNAFNNGGFSTDMSSADEIMDLLPGFWRIAIPNSTIFPAAYGMLETIQASSFGLARFTTMNAPVERVWVRGWNTVEKTWYDADWKEVTTENHGSYTQDPTSVDDLMNKAEGNYMVAYGDTTIFPNGWGILELIHGGLYGIARFTTVNTQIQRVWERSWNIQNKTWYNNTWVEVTKLYPLSVTPAYSTKVTPDSNYCHILSGNGITTVQLVLTIAETIAANTDTSLATGLPHCKHYYQFFGRASDGSMVKLRIGTTGNLQMWYTAQMAQGTSLIIDTTYFNN